MEKGIEAMVISILLLPNVETVRRLFCKLPLFIRTLLLANMWAPWSFYDNNKS